MDRATRVEIGLERPRIAISFAANLQQIRKTARPEAYSARL
jgi:hypothetical protein